MLNKKNEQIKKILEKFNYAFSEESIREVEKNISALAEVVVNFEESKRKKPKHTKPP